MTTTTKPHTITDNALNKFINDHLTNLPKINDIVKGTVISATNKEILVDIDGFTIGVARGREVKNLPNELRSLKQGDSVDAMVIDLDNEKGQMELSLHLALTEGAWLYIKEKEKFQEILDLRIVGANKGGILASIRGIPAFLPVSQLSPEHYPKVEGGDKKKILKKLKSFIGKTLSVKIINHNPDEEKIIISEKRAWEVLQRQKLQKYHTGDILAVTVKALTAFGAFVEFGDHMDGLIHISEFPENQQPAFNQADEIQPEKDSQIAAPPTQLKIDDKIDAKIIDIRGTRVFFSLKQK